MNCPKCGIEMEKITVDDVYERSVWWRCKCGFVVSPPSIHIEKLRCRISKNFAGRK